MAPWSTRHLVFLGLRQYVAMASREGQVSVGWQSQRSLPGGGGLSGA